MTVVCIDTLFATISRFIHHAVLAFQPMSQK